jgi:hypothetical protein
VGLGQAPTLGAACHEGATGSPRHTPHTAITSTLTHPPTLLLHTRLALRRRIGCGCGTAPSLSRLTRWGAIVADGGRGGGGRSPAGRGGRDGGRGGTFPSPIRLPVALPACGAVVELGFHTRTLLHHRRHVSTSPTRLAASPSARHKARHVKSAPLPEALGKETSLAGSRYRKSLYQRPEQPSPARADAASTNARPSGCRTD